MAFQSIFRTGDGWRKFLGEVAIVFLGVVIALVAQKLVEERDWRAKRAQAIAGMKDELANDDAVMSSAMIARSACVTDLLDRLQGIVDGGADRQQFAALAQTMPSERLTWDSEALEAAKLSGALINGGDDLTLVWTAPYFAMNILSSTYEDYLENRARLTAWSRRPGAMNEIERERATLAIEALRMANTTLTKGSASQLLNIKEMGIEPHSADQRGAYQDVRDRLGNCAIDPTTVDLMSLRSPQAAKVNPRAR